MIELPNEKTKASRVNPKKIILFSNPKSGKTTAVAALENNLILDLEDGSEFLDALKINVLEISRKSGNSPLIVLKEVINKIAESNKTKGGYTYKYITIDTVSALNNVKCFLKN